MNFKRIILLLMFLTSTCAWGQAKKPSPMPELIVESSEFKQVNKNDVLGAGGPIMRGEVVLLLKSLPDKAKWVRNVEVEVTVAFENKNPASGEPKFILLDARAKIFALELNKKTPVAFYIPWESYAMYRINRAPDYFVINVFADSREIPIDETNVKQRLSKNIKNLKELQDFKAKVLEASGRNKGVMKPLNECAVNIQYYEYVTRSSVPTYLDTK